MVLGLAGKGGSRVCVPSFGDSGMTVAEAKRRLFGVRPRMDLNLAGPLIKAVTLTSHLPSPCLSFPICKTGSC